MAKSTALLPSLHSSASDFMLTYQASPISHVVGCTRPSFLCAGEIYSVPQEVGLAIARLGPYANSYMSVLAEVIKIKLKVDEGLYKHVQQRERVMYANMSQSVSREWVRLRR